jgi:hypothetical protein
MKPGIYEMADEAYFADPATSNSDLKLLRRSAEHFKYLKAHPKERTPAMQAGSSLHCAILEPDNFMKRHAVIPDNAPRKPTTAQRNSAKPTPDAQERMQYWDQWELMNQGKLIVTPEKAAEYMEIGGLIRNHPELSVFFDSGKAEHAVFGEDPETGLMCKCKPDYLTRIKDYKICIEVKSCEDARNHAFQRTAYNFQYFTAAAFYQDVMSWSIGAPDAYLIVAFERDPPYGMKIYEVSEESIERGREQYRESLALMKQCMEDDHWPIYDTDIELLELPHWAKEI